MLTVNEIAGIIVSMPTVRSVSSDESYWREAVSRVIRPVLDEIGVSYDWDFSIDNSSETSVGNQSTYELTGNNNNLRDIIAIRYGSDGTTLLRMSAVDAYDRLQNSSTFGSVVAWYQSGVNAQGYPKIVLLDTPATASTFEVRFRIKDIPLSSFPADFGWMIVKGVLAFVIPELRIEFENALRKTIKRHKAGGKDYNPMTLDPQILAGNQQISSLYRRG